MKYIYFVSYILNNEEFGSLLTKIIYPMDHPDFYHLLQVQVAFNEWHVAVGNKLVILNFQLLRTEPE